MLPVPGLTIASPMDEVELRNLMFTAASGEGPFVIRYPRGNGVTRDWRRPMETLPLGRGRILREGKDLALLTIALQATMRRGRAEQAAGEGISVLHADLRFAKPLDEGLLHRIGREFRPGDHCRGRSRKRWSRCGCPGIYEPSRLPLPYNDVGCGGPVRGTRNGRPA